MSRNGICIGIVSGKGGVGKTSLTAALGAALARLGRRALCVDCDASLRNLDLVMGMTEQSLMDFTDVAAGRCTLEEAVSEHPRQTGLFLLNAPAFGGDSLMQPQMRALADHIRRHFDFCLLDAPAGLGPAFDLVTAAANRILVVTQTDPLSVRDAQRVVMELSDFPSGDASLIVNRVKPFSLRPPELTVDDVMDQVGLPLMGLVSDDAAFPQALRRGLPVTLSAPNATASRDCVRIARRLLGDSVKLPFFYR